MLALLCLSGLSVAIMRHRHAGDAGEDKPLVAVVYYLGLRVFTIDLDNDSVFTLAMVLGVPESAVPRVVFEVTAGAIAFISSDCPDLLCVNMGWQDRDGGFAACLPNRLLFYIEYKESSD